MSEQRFSVVDDVSESRYVLVDSTPALNEKLSGVEGPVGIGLIDYVDVPSGASVERVLFHTEVSPDYAGQGLASVLAQGAVEDIAARAFVLVPVCPYVAGWLPKHPEFAHIVVAPTPTHIEAVASRA